MTRWSSLSRPLAALACLLGGAAVGVCAVLLHDYWWGLPLGVATTAAVMAALPPAWWGRFAFALGWVAVLWRTTTERSEGDYLVSSDLNGYVLLAVGMGVLAAAFAGLLRRGTAAD